MGCELQDCNYFKAEQLAKSVVDANPGDLLDKHARIQKLAELGAIELMFEKCASECPGKQDNGMCGSSSIINDARTFVFSTPNINVTARPDRSVGYARS